MPIDPASAPFVALLRGVNVGGKNRLAMRDLAAACARLGAADVRTYIQSGNVVFTATPRLAGSFSAALAQRLAAAHGLTVPVVVRSAAALRAVLAADPFTRRGADPAHLHVAFLAGPPPRAAVAALDPARSPGDRFAVIGEEIWLHLPNGVARSKLTVGWFDAALGTTTTIRNLRTVQTLLAMTAERPDPV